MKREAAIAAATELSALDDLRVEYLGKKGQADRPVKRPRLHSLMKSGPLQVRKINEVKQALQARNQSAQRTAGRAQRSMPNWPSETIDVTLPGRGEEVGGLHPVTRTMERIEAFFARIGYELRPARKSKTTTTTSKR